MKITRTARVASVLGISALALAACGDGGGEDMNVTIGYVPWDEVVAATYLWQHILEEEGYTVELVQLEPAAVYAATGQNDTDLYMGGLPETHRDYWDQYGDNFESVATWYQPLIHSLVVPEYVDAETIEDLEGRADEFGGRIIGIEPGSGLMQELEQATETYDLSGYEVVAGSSAAMLAEFERAVENEEDIVAAAWSPHWAVDEYNMKFLEDPRDSFVDGDNYNVIASEDAQQKEGLISLLSNFQMDDDALFSLLSELNEAGTGNESEAVDAWLAEAGNQALVDSWLGDN